MKKLLTVLLLIFLATVGFSQTVDGVKKATIEGTTYVKSPKLVLDRSATTTTETIKNIGGVLYWGNAPLFTTSTLDTTTLATKTYVTNRTTVKANISDTGTYLLGRTRAASTYQVKGNYLTAEVDPVYIADTSKIAFTTQQNSFNQDQIINGLTIGKGIGGSNNTVFGYGALGNNNGSNNIAIGTYAMENPTYSSYNMGVGITSLQNISSGTYNTGIGYGTLSQMSTGEYNTAIGHESSKQNSSGGFNTAVGAQSLFYNTGSSNTAIGTTTLFRNTSGEFNTAVGNIALENNKTGSYNTAVGSRALQPKKIGDNNVSIGADAGYYSKLGSQIDTMNNSVLVGRGTRPLLNNQTNEIIIGYNAIGNGSNTATYGNNSITKHYFTSGRIFAENLSTIASLDTVIRYDPLTGELIASPDHFTFFDNTLSTGNNVLTSGTFTAGGGTDYVQITAQNAVRLEGTASVWDDLLGPFNSGLSGGSAYPVFVVDSNYYTFNIDTTGPTICKQYFSIQMPHGWKQYSTIYPHVHYVYTAAQGVPTFIIKYRWTDNGQKPGRYTWLRLNTNTGTGEGALQMNSNATGISGAGHTISSLLDMQVYLLSTTGVTKTIFGKSYDVHYEIDALGSNDVVSKN
jgi:hypothetical protein